jgi:hypothetical protein
MLARCITLDLASTSSKRGARVEVRGLRARCLGQAANLQFSEGALLGRSGNAQGGGRWT